MWTQQAEDRVLQSLLVKLFFKALLFLFIIIIFLKLIHSFSLTHTHTNILLWTNWEGKSHIWCRAPANFCKSTACLQLLWRRRAGLVVHRFSCCTAVSAIGQRGLLSCHAREESEEDEGCHRQPHRACSLCLGKWNLFVLSTCTPVVCSCQIRLSNQEASGRRRL